MYPKAKILIAIWQIIAAHASVSSTNTVLLKHRGYKKFMIIFSKTKPIYNKLQLLFQSEQLANETKVISM